MGIVLQVLGILSIFAGGLIFIMDWLAPVGHKFIIIGLVIFVVGQNCRKIKKLEKRLEEREKDSQRGSE